MARVVICVSELTTVACSDAILPCEAFLLLEACAYPDVLWCRINILLLVVYVRNYESSEPVIVKGRLRVGVDPVLSTVVGWAGGERLRGSALQPPPATEGVMPSVAICLQCVRSPGCYWAAGGNLRVSSFSKERGNLVRELWRETWRAEKGQKSLSSLYRLVLLHRVVCLNYCCALAEVLEKTLWQRHFPGLGSAMEQLLPKQIQENGSVCTSLSCASGCGDVWRTGMLKWPGWKVLLPLFHFWNPCQSLHNQWQRTSNSSLLMREAGMRIFLYGSGVRRWSWSCACNRNSSTFFWTNELEKITFELHW